MISDDDIRKQLQRLDAAESGPVDPSGPPPRQNHPRYKDNPDEEEAPEECPECGCDDVDCDICLECEKCMCDGCCQCEPEDEEEKDGGPGSVD